MANELILAVDDEAHILELLSFNLEASGYRVVTAATGEDALVVCAHERPAMVLLDIMLPGIDGMEVCRRLKGAPTTADIPIIMLTAKGDEVDKILGLELGADDYITKPFSVEELLARLRVALRRLQYMRSPAAADEAVFTNGRLRVDYAAGCAYVDEAELHLTPVEYKLLCLMARNVGKVLTHNCFIKEVWQNTLPEDTPSLRVYMATLRKKLETPLKQKLIQTHVGIGYRMLRLTSDKPANDGGLGGGAR
ncbi:MAG: response regulator transcription factor [Clostridia bacterium]